MAQAWHDVVGIKFLMDSGGCGQPDLGSTELWESLQKTNKMETWFDN